MSEEWRNVVGFENFYQVSNLGRVKRIGKTKTMKLYPDKDGYLMVRLSKSNKPYNCRVSRLVLTAFCGAPIAKQEAMHINHDKTNNTVSNLAWGTRLENEQQKTLSGRRIVWSKLSDKDVEKIKKLRATGMTLKEIGVIVGTHFSNVSLICRGVTHK